MGGLVSLLVGGGKSKYTPPVATAAPQPTQATSANTSVTAAGDEQRRLAGMAGGLASTIKTSAGGAADSGTTVYKSLLGE